MYILIFQQLLWESFADIFYFPIWWYTSGAMRSAKWCFGLLSAGNSELSPGLWLQNIFVPMYGQYDWQGRIISFVMRSFQVVVRSVALFAWLICCIVVFFIWLLIPVAISYAIIITLATR